jgi:hypothetical protein
MQTNKYLPFIILAFIIISPGCKKFDLKSDDFTLSADLNILKTNVNFTFVDAATGQMIETSSSSNLKIEVISPINRLIVSTLGEYQTVFTPNYSFFSFSLNPYSVVPTPEKPIALLIKTTIDNYLESLITLTLSEERNYNLIAKLVNLPKPPSGFIIEEFADVGTTSSTGETRENISVKTTGNELRLEIEKGTILKDQSGQPLSGSLSVQMMWVDVSTAEGYRNVPAINQPLITENGGKTSLFNPIAFSRVKIKDADGRTAASVAGKDMLVITALRSNIPDPEFHKPLASGDLVPSYYFDRQDGHWKFFGQDTVAEENGQLTVVKIIRSKKSAGNENFSEITYSFDESTPIDIQILINLPAERPILPATITAIVEGIGPEVGPTVLFNNDITLFTLHTAFTINNLSSDFASYKVILAGDVMIDANGVWIQKTIDELASGLFRYTFDFRASQFKDTVAADGPTRLYLQFTCLPTSGNPVDLDSPDLPESFYLIFSGTGFTGETVLQVQGGTFVLPFNPLQKTGGSWQVKVIMGDMEYPTGNGRVSVTASDFLIGDGKVILRYSPETPEECDDFKKALGID